MSCPENQDKGLGQKLFESGLVWLDQRKKTCEIALTSFALAHSLLAGQKNKNQCDKQEELLF